MARPKGIAKTARQAGAENLKKPEIADAIQEAQKARADHVQIEANPSRIARARAWAEDRG